MNTIKLTCIQKREKAAYPPKEIPATEKYYLLFWDELSSPYRWIEVEVPFESIEPMILSLHGIGILGQRRYSNTDDCHLTEWEIPHTNL